MQVHAAPPLAVASLLWQPRPMSFVLTILCKATYTLKPGVSPLAVTPDPVLPANLYWQDDPLVSIQAPSDFVPFKRHVDVVLRGHVYAPYRQPTKSLVARIEAGPLNKAAAVHGDRRWTLDGRLSEPVPFTKMPLRWERAAGGPTTWNPAGIPMNTPAQLRYSLPVPNLQPVGFNLQSPMQLIPPTGFGPIAPQWPTRMVHLRQHGAGWMHDTWYERPLPADIDAAYFNVAPPDQQIEKLPDRVPLLLEHLHPEIPSLSTVIEDVCPFADVNKSGVVSGGVGLRCDTLFVDTDRGTCTLTWRASVPVTHPHEEVVVVVRPTRGYAANKAIQEYGASAGPTAATTPEQASVKKERAPFAWDEDEAVTLDGPVMLDSAVTLDGPVMLIDELTHPDAPFPSSPGPLLPFTTANSTIATLIKAPGSEPTPRPPNAGRSGKTIAQTYPASFTFVPVLPFGATNSETPIALPTSATDPIPTALKPRRSVTLIPTVSPLPNAPVLPFVAAESPPSPTLEAREGELAPHESDDETGRLAGPTNPVLAVLPFETLLPIELARPTSTAPPQLTPIRPLIESGGQAEVKRAGVKTPKATLSLEQYAQIKIELWGANASLHEVLERHGIDEIEWHIYERQQADALAVEGREGRCDLALALMQALEASRAQGGEPLVMGRAEATRAASGTARAERGGALRGTS